MTTQDETVRVDHEALARFAESVFTGAGLEGPAATILTDALVRASLRGVDTHGIGRVEPYSRKLDDGGYNPSPEITIERLTETVALVDADEGPGPVGASRAMEDAVATARTSGIGSAVVANSNHFGMAAYYTLYAAEHDCIGVAMSHGGPRVAPFGGVDPFLGTSPIAYSVPTNREFSITLDMATSAGANAKIRQARRQGKSIPADWAIDENGRPTTDPTAVHALRPVGGAKGYGLGLLVEICSGLLAGMHFAPEVPTPFEDFGSPMGIGHFVLAMDIAAFRDVGAFKADVDRLIDRLKAVPTAPGVDEIRLPGERSARTAADRERTGIPITQDTRERLVAVGDRYGVTFPDP